MAKVTEASELKFLLDLVSYDGCRSKLNKVKISSKTPASVRKAVANSLISRGYLECTKEIKKFTTAGAGKELLKHSVESLPVGISSQEIAALKVGEKKASPGSLGQKVPANERQTLLSNLADRGLIEIEDGDKEISEVWLSTQGRQFLQSDYVIKGNWTITATKLGHYVAFLRNSDAQMPSSSLPAHQPAQQQLLSQPQMQSGESMPIGSASGVTAQAVLQHIKQLDQMLGTENYLPIYHLREKLQPPLTRESLDERLYELQRNDQIELSSLHDQGDYSELQISAGIAQNHGRSLFFIEVL